MQMENFNKFCLKEREFCTFNGVSLDKLTSLINKLDNCFKKDSENFAETCFVVYRIYKLFNDYKQVYSKSSIQKIESYNFDTIMQGFGIGKSESCRILQCYEKYCSLSCSDLEIAKCRIVDEFRGFSKSKLFELLTVDNDVLIRDLSNGVIRFDYSVKALRDYVKNIQNLKKLQSQTTGLNEDKDEDVIDENTIPLAFNPQQHYEFQYFEEKSKSQLLNMIWELQKEYEKLKTNFDKLKRSIR